MSSSTESSTSRWLDSAMAAGGVVALPLVVFYVTIALLHYDGALVVPDLESGNILYKDLTYLAGADAAGVVLGARLPVILTSRADTVRTRIASAALAALVVRHGVDLGAAPA